MNVLITCEYSGRVRDAFSRKGHNSMSCDLLDTEAPGPHYKGDMFDIIGGNWDFIGSHYSCTFMANSGSRWLYNSDGTLFIERWIELEKAVTTFRKILDSIKVGYLENPIPHRHARDGFYSVVTGEWVEGIGKCSQIIQPWQFGDTTKKATCLWLKGLPKLKPTNIVPKELRTDEVHKAPPGPNRWKERSRTFLGISTAMGEQWG